LSLDTAFVLDYLMEEVLERQSESVQTFLLKTAILDRLTGSLCDAVRFGVAETPRLGSAKSPTGQDNGQMILETLERANLFIVPLDEERRWYRYHHLFADLLRQRLRQVQPEQVSTLHRQAATWYEAQGLAAEALRHVFAAGDFQEVVHSRPKLCLLSAWAMYGSGQPEAIDPFLLSVESHLRDAGSGLVAGTDRFTETTEATLDVPPLSRDVLSLIAEVAAIRAFVARARGDLPRAIELFRRMLL
jgi:LuxR family maltose regulon positive regulatory protein